MKLRHEDVDAMVFVVDVQHGEGLGVDVDAVLGGAFVDQYLRGGTDPYTAQSAYQRLTSLASYDASADSNRLGKVSIGAGTFDPTAAAADPTNDAAGNLPYTIKGIPIVNSLSFYYYSQFRLTDPRTHHVRRCSDMLAHCPKVTPSTP